MSGSMEAKRSAGSTHQGFMRPINILGVLGIGEAAVGAEHGIGMDGSDIARELEHALTLGVDGVLTG